MIALAPHPSTPTDAVHVSARAERDGDGTLRVRYRFAGVRNHVRVPPPGPERRADRLWEHTCAEAFVAAEGARGYVELNVAPSRAWAAYAFTGYREGAPLDAPGLAPRIDVRRDDDTVAIDVHVPLAVLAPSYPHAPLRLGLTAVVETTDGRLAYFALRHPEPRPDFHHADGFVLRLPAPTRSDGRGAAT